MIEERQILRSWVDETIAGPDRTRDEPEGTRHYLRRIPEREGRRNEDSI